MERLENNRSKVKIYHYSNCNFRLARSQKIFTLTKEKRKNSNFPVLKVFGSQLIPSLTLIAFNK